MIIRTRNRRINVLVDAPLLRRIRDLALHAGVSSYVVLPVLSGDDERGRWADDQVTGGAGSKVVFSATVDAALEDPVIEALAPLMDDYSLTVTVSDVEVLKPQK